MIPKHRQIRVRVTGGKDDVAELAAAIKAHMAAKGLSGDQWNLTWDVYDTFGAVGPLNKATLGFTATS